MTAAADRTLLSDWKAGKFTTREQHLVAVVGTIDHPDELERFRTDLSASGGMTDELKTAIYRRQKQIGVKA
jgi:hypothetical protein